MRRSGSISTRRSVIDEQLYETLASEEAFYLRAEPLRHPLIFYFGHTATFYINKLHRRQDHPERINPRFESMFAVGVDEMSWDDLNEAHYDWPTLAELKVLSRRGARTGDDRIRTMPLTLPIDWDNPFWVILMGIEHQRIHLETSSVIIRRLPLEMVRPAAALGDLPGNGRRARTIELLPVTGGTWCWASPKTHPLYGWDNEFGRHETTSRTSWPSRYLVSNQEYLGFVEDRGYEQQEFWTEKAGDGSAIPRPGIRCSGSNQPRATDSATWHRSSTCPGTGRSK